MLRSGHGTSQRNMNWRSTRQVSAPKCRPKPHTMSNYCEPLLAALKDCVLHSDCVIKNDKLPSECIKHHLDELPEECRSLRLATFECKRGMVLYPFPFSNSIPFSCLFNTFSSLICENASAGIVQVLLPRGSSKRTRLPRPRSSYLGLIRALRNDRPSSL